jgi:hypothetical protein
MRVRKAAVAGRWYPSEPDRLAEVVDGYLAAVASDASVPAVAGELAAIVVPHAGLMYSGPIAASAYSLLTSWAFDVAFMVGPSHFVSFEGVHVDPSDAFDTPLGAVTVDHAAAGAIIAATLVVRENSAAHTMEHSLEMQLPFLKRVAPAARIVPLLMGRQTAETARALGDGLAAAARGRRALLIASTDLSHYHDAQAAARLDGVVIDRIAAGDAEGLQQALDADPRHACGGGPTVAVMRAAGLLGAARPTILRYGDSGDVSGDKSSVVGYLAAAISHDQRG